MHWEVNNIDTQKRKWTNERIGKYGSLLLFSLNYSIYSRMDFWSGSVCWCCVSSSWTCVSMEKTLIKIL